MSAPRPRRDEVVVRIHSARLDSGFSGVVVEVGCEVSSMSVGDGVFGAGARFVSDAERLVCPVSSLTRKPVTLRHSEAAALAIAGTVALRAIRLAGVPRGGRVLVSGASGSTGSLALQIARAAGSHVTGACRDRDVPMVWELGADHVYAPERRPEESTRFAAIIDTDASVTPDQAQELLHPDGCLVRVRGQAIHVQTASGDSVVADSDSRPTKVDLEELAELVDRDCLYPLLARSAVNRQ